jgi:hypothetical protein
MANKQSASNQFVRTVLTLVGESRDLEVLGLAPGQLRGAKLRLSLLAEFKNKCAYCQSPITAATSDIDHVVPMNKASLGLHMYGNLVPTCKPCNSDKHSDSLDEFISKHPGRVSVKVSANLKQRSNKYGSDLDTKPLRDFVQNLYSAVSDLVEQKRSEGTALLPKPTKATKAAAMEIQRKSEFDFSAIAKVFPLGALVQANKDGLVGVVVDYSLEGDKGKRKPYVRFQVEGRKLPVTRSPQQLIVIRFT